MDETKRPIDGVGLKVAHEAPVDLEVIDRQELQIGIGREAGPEIVDREGGSERSDLLHEGLARRRSATAAVSVISKQMRGRGSRTRRTPLR
jgi:hypothetical protein